MYRTEEFMYRTEELLSELREVQDKIAKIEFVKDTNYEKYNEALKEYEKTFYILQYVCDGKDTIGRYALPGNDKILRGLIQLLLDFESDVANDKANAVLLKILRDKENLLKDELGIK